MLKGTNPRIPLIASDFGLQGTGTEWVNGQRVTATLDMAWAEMDIKTRRFLFDSQDWEPVDPKPAMLILAEASCDWSIHEASLEDEKEA